ncbi:hypothetical protein V8B97DRAFT_2012110 [Scleroderma yunnanense]
MPKTKSHPTPAQPDTQCADPPHTPEGINMICRAASKINDDGEYISASSTWFGPGDNHNISFQPTPTSQSLKDQGILGALLLVLQRTNPLDDLTIHIGDRNIIQNLTTKLDWNENLN